MKTTVTVLFKGLLYKATFENMGGWFRTSAEVECVGRCLTGWVPALYRKMEVAAKKRFAYNA